MGSDKRKVLKTAYKDKSIAGGIYCIECGGNHHRWIKSTRNLESQKNRFEFAVSTRSCPEPSMLAEWSEYGVESFSFVILEELEKKETQTEREFLDDLEVLLEIWLEKDEHDAR